MSPIETRISRRIIEWLSHGSLEVSPRHPKVVETLRAHARAGAEVFISFVPGESYHRVAETAVALRQAGFEPVPHIAARQLMSFTQLRDFVSRAATDAGVTRALVIAGDVEQPRGPFASSLDVIATGLLEAHGIRSIGIAGYPEGNPRVTSHLLEQALADKLQLAAAHGLSPWIVTQFCFAPEPITAWTAALSRRGIAVPVRIGLAGPASATTLLKFAIRCGIGNSLHALRSRPNSITRLLDEAAPDAILGELAAACERDPVFGFAGLHFFSFGGVVKTCAWIDANLARLNAACAVAS